MNEQRETLQPFFACCFHRFSPKEWVTSMRLRLGSFGYTVASQSILKRYTCILCTVSSWISQERSARVMGNRCGCFPPLSPICFTHSVGGQVAMMFGKSTQSVVCTDTPQPPPKWEVNTHQSNKEDCWLFEPNLLCYCPVWGTRYLKNITVS